MADTARGPRRHTEFYFENAYVTFFYSSWSETVQALWRGRLIEAAEPRSMEPQQARLEVPASCAPATKPPHIILIHQESVVPPAFFPTLSYDRSLDPFFRSLDGRLNKLRVETYGGASWLTEFSLLTGLSTQSFGGMRQFLQHVMAGKIHDTLPQALARCGYRNVMFYPMLRRFLGSGRFFEARRVSRDLRRQGAGSQASPTSATGSTTPTRWPRSTATSRRRPSRCSFTSRPWPPTAPTTTPTAPRSAVAGGGPGTHPEMSEYLRRLAMARMDYAFLRSELVRRFPRQAFLIVHYGDHQPTATQSLLGFDENASIEDIMASGNDDARMTYYALDAVRYRPPPLPSPDTLDVAYLGTMLLEAAGVQLSDLHRAPTWPDARHNFALVEAGHGVHNVNYAFALLDKAHDQMNVARRARGPAPLGLPWPATPAGAAACMSCHSGVENQSGTFAGKAFPHGPHVVRAKLECSACHRPHAERAPGESDQRSARTAASAATTGRGRAAWPTAAAATETSRRDAPAASAASSRTRRTWRAAWSAETATP